MLVPQPRHLSLQTLPSSQTPTTPQRKPSTWLAWWTPPVLLIDLPRKDTYCLREEILLAGHLVYFLPFLEEIIQADRWILEIVHHEYSIELIRTSNFKGPGTHQPLLKDCKCCQTRWRIFYGRCSSTDSSRPCEEWVLQHLFPSTQEGRRPQTHLEPEVLKLKCLQDFVQDGDCTPS